MFNDDVELRAAEQSWEPEKEWRGGESESQPSGFFRKSADSDATARHFNINSFRTLFIYKTMTKTVTSRTSCIPATLFSTLSETITDKNGVKTTNYYPSTDVICRRKRREPLIESDTEEFLPITYLNDVR